MKKSKHKRRNRKLEAMLEVLFRRKWIKLPYILFKFLKPDEAVMLAALIDKSNYVMEFNTRRYWKIDDGAFYYTMKEIENELHLSVYTQTRLLKALANKGLIEARMSGRIPVKHGGRTRRYIRIIWERLGECIESVQNKERADEVHISVFSP